MALWQQWSLLSWRDRGLLMEAVVFLALARGAVCTVPFKAIVPYLRRTTPVKTEAVEHEWVEEARRVGWAVRAVASRTVWDSNCLAQAIAGRIMLWRRGIPSAVYLGAAKMDDVPGPLAAHAWLRCATGTITGAAGQERFTIIAIFGDK